MGSEQGAMMVSGTIPILPQAADHANGGWQITCVPPKFEPIENGKVLPSFHAVVVDRDGNLVNKAAQQKHLGKIPVFELSAEEGSLLAKNKKIGVLTREVTSGTHRAEFSYKGKEITLTGDALRAKKNK